MNKSKIIILLFLIIIGFPRVTLAQNNTPPSNTATINIPSPLKPGVGDTLLQLLSTVLNKIVMPIAAVAVVVWIIYAGFTFLTAQGNPNKIQDAQQRLLWSLIGAGILLGAAAISKVVETTVSALLT